MKSGLYFVAQGGLRELYNYHFPVPAQRYAMDLTKLDTWGRRANGLFPQDLNQYEIYGEELYAVCTGTVADLYDAVSGREPDRVEQIAGNFVALECEEMTVVYAHLQDGLEVAIGDSVGPNRALGRVGNTGRSTEPHLHVHAVHGVDLSREDMMFNGEGLPITIAHQILFRNDTLDLRQPREQ
jgi:hypothetical protein